MMNMVRIDPEKLIRTSIACPSQWEGNTEDGRKVYIRYRHDNLTINLSFYPSEDVDDALNGETILEQMNVIGDGVNGYMTLTELNKILSFNNISTNPDLIVENEQGSLFTLDEGFENVTLVKKTKKE